MHKYEKATLLEVLERAKCQPTLERCRNVLELYTLELEGKRAEALRLRLRMQQDLEDRNAELTD